MMRRRTGRENDISMAIERVLRRNPLLVERIYDDRDSPLDIYFRDKREVFFGRTDLLVIALKDRGVRVISNTKTQIEELPDWLKRESVVRKIWKSMEEGGEVMTANVDALIEFARDREYYGIRFYAVLALSKLNDEMAIPVLVERLTDENQEINRETAKALVNFIERNPKNRKLVGYIPYLINLLDGWPGTKKAIINILTALEKDDPKTFRNPEVVSTMIRFLMREGPGKDGIAGILRNMATSGEVPRELMETKVSLACALQLG